MHQAEDGTAEADIGTNESQGNTYGRLGYVVHKSKEFLDTAYEDEG
jgi:hypothetical protein